VPQSGLPRTLENSARILVFEARIFAESAPAATS
jgi:hypothetical protein